MKKTIILSLLVVLSIKTIYAHNPLSAAYYLEVKNQFGILNVSLSQAGLQQALIKHYPNMEFEELNEVEYKQLAVNYLKDNFSLKVNGNQIKLLNGGIKLGGHQTDIKFITSDLPLSFNDLAISISAFKENNHHQTIFSFSLNGNANKIILREANNYTALVTFEKGSMLIQKEEFNKKYFWFLTAIPLFFFSKKLMNGRNK